MLEDDAYLMESQNNQVAYRGRLRLDDDGRLTFTLAEGGRGGGAPKWLKKRLGDDLDARLEAGEEITVVDLQVAGQRLKWPWNMNWACRVDDGQHKWLISLRNPMTLTSIGQAVNVFKGSKAAKPWKEALAAAGAR
jgi:hypothetical protein